MKWLRGGLLLLALLSAGVEAAEPKRVLVIHSFGRDFAPFTTTASAFRIELAQLLGGQVLFHDASFEAERGGPPQGEAAFVEFLRTRYIDARPDLVVTMGAPALRFYLRSRAQLFRQTPLLSSIIDYRRLQGTKLEAQDRVVSVRLDIAGSVRGILELLPETRTLAVVVGASPHELSWQDEIVRELAPFSDRIRLVPLGGLAPDQVRQRVAALPTNSAVFYFMYVLGPDGVPQENERALDGISEASNSPVFGLYVNQLGNGIVGGRLLDLRGVGELSARTAHRMLDLEGRSESASAELAAQALAFDHRQLRRWGIPESRLPPGAEVRFRPPSAWDEHRLLILTGIGIVLFQAALISGLLFQRIRRRIAEEKAAGLGGRLITAQEDERKRLARDLHDDVSQQLAGLSIAFSRLKHRMAASQAAEDLQADVRALHERTTALAQNVRYLSHDLHPTVLRHVGLVAALKSYCSEVERSKRMVLSFSTEGDVASVNPAAALCLYRIAQEALRNVVTHAGARRAEVHLFCRWDQAELTITDNGNGFDVADALKQSDGLGLVSINERARLAGGGVSITAEQGKGTCVRVRIPTGAPATSESGVS